ncbi:GGDEF domain-containing protein [Desulfopila sp. IMCC35008]|uniref:GGDEF domain-containing protein n=1 Tax=Desulfopila sp. IMCC35008 TaxID=2653858 RepID=UPI0013D5F0E1|nr:GGDEF domain-containing protein [Desulfopila sp. IMCC35008]
MKDIVINEEMLFTARGDINRRSVTGCFIYLLLWFANIIPNKLYVSSPEICLWFTVVFILLSAGRVLLMISFETIYRKSALSWKLLFYPIIWLPAICWGALCSLSMILPELEPFSLVIIICTAGLAGGGVTALLASRVLTIGLISCLLLPGMVTAFLFAGDNLSLGLVFGIYWLGMYSITRIQHREYWRALKYSFMIKRYNTELERLNALDGLTGLKNRSFFDSSLKKEIKAATRVQASISLLLIDIDHFKVINDRHGHLVGDECLRRLSLVLQSEVQRETDIVARYGGEEFAIILPGNDLEHALFVAERIRARAEDIDQYHGDMKISFTVSVGVASCTPYPGYKEVQLIEKADSALYKAKNRGRNSVCS